MSDTDPVDNEVTAAEREEYLMESVMNAVIMTEVKRLAKEKAAETNEE